MLLEYSQCAQNRACINTDSLDTPGTAVETNRDSKSVDVPSLFSIGFVILQFNNVNCELKENCSHLMADCVEVSVQYRNLKYSK